VVSGLNDDVVEISKQIDNFLRSYRE